MTRLITFLLAGAFFFPGCRPRISLDSVREERNRRLEAGGGTERALDELSWEPAARGTHVRAFCGRNEEKTAGGELADGYAVFTPDGNSRLGWGKIGHCWHGDDAFGVELTTPAGVGGTLSLFFADPDRKKRKQRVELPELGWSIDVYLFETGVWANIPVSEAATADGKVTVRFTTLEGPNAVLSEVRFDEK